MAGTKGHASDDERVGVAEAAGKPKLLEVVRRRLREPYYSLRTEEAYVGWIRC